MKFIELVKKDFKLTALICFFIFLPLLIYALVKSDIETAFLFIIITVISILGVLASNFSGRKKHKAVLSSGKLEVFKQLGFEIENFNDYAGYKGIYQGYLVRIFFDYYATNRGNLSDTQICFILYYKMPYSAHDKIRLLRRLQDKYTGQKIFSFDSKRIVPNPFSLEYHVPYITWFHGKKLTDRLDELIAIAKLEGLLPMPEAEFIARSARSPWEFAPPIETYTDYL